MNIELYDDIHLFEQCLVYGDLCTNHHCSQQLYEELVQGCEAAGVVPKLQLFSEQTFNRKWPVPKVFAASCFRPDDVDFAMRHNPLALKLASVEATHSALLELLMETAKPLIVSTGGLDEDELVDLVGRIQDYDHGVCLMHCVSMYPTRLEHCNMLRVSTLADALEDYLLPPYVGWSCHTPLVWRQPLIAAITQGASQFEVHVVSSGSKPKTDDERSSLTIKELTEFQGTIRAAVQVIGTGDVEQVDRAQVLEWRARWQTAEIINPVEK